MKTFTVIIENDKGVEEIVIKDVQTYKMLDGGVFYVVGKGYEQWHFLKKGFSVTVEKP